MGEYYGDNKLKRKNLRPAIRVDFKGIARHHNVNIMLYESMKDSGKDAGSIWQLIYDKIEYKTSLTKVNMGTMGSYCFYMKNMEM